MDLTGIQDFKDFYINNAEEMITIIEYAFSKFMKKHEEDLGDISKRTEYSLIGDLIFKSLLERFSENPDFYFINSEQQRFVIYNDSIRIRIKKLSKSHKASYNPTLSSEKFENQLELGTGKKYHLNCYLGYIPNTHGLSIYDIVMVIPKYQGNERKVVSLYDYVNKDKQLEFAYNINPLTMKEKPAKPRIMRAKLKDQRQDRNISNS